MCPKRLLIICYVLISVDTEMENMRNRREGRLFSFNTVEDDITVHLDFSVPFLSIPVKRTMDSTLGAMGLPMVNINPASLALGGAVVLGSTVLVPLLFKGYTDHYVHNRYSRILDNTEFGSDVLINFASQMWANNRSLRGCALRISCWIAQENPGDAVMVVHSIMSNKLLSTIINSTAMEDAMVSGKHGRDCISYSPCPLNEDHISMIINNILALTS